MENRKLLNLSTCNSISDMLQISSFKNSRCLRPVLVLFVAASLTLTFYSLDTFGEMYHATAAGQVVMRFKIPTGPSLSLISFNSKQTYKEKQSCVHPQLQTWPPEMMKFFTKNEALQCNRLEENWVYTINGTFYISDVVADKHGGRIDCQIVPILRGSDDFRLRRGDAVKSFINGSTLVSDVFEAKCVAGDGKRYSMVLSGIAPKAEVIRRAESVPVIRKSAVDLDILMFGFDSVSRMSWLRNLPKSYEYFVTELGGVILEGYNIVGDGTLRALLPILTGKTDRELPESRRGFWGAKTVDGHPWIWKDLVEMGYVTQIAEDYSHAGSFTYMMNGFKNQPVDHYMRPFYIEAEKHYKKYPPFCLGSLPRHKNMMNYMRDFCNVYKSQRKFSFVFHNEYSHGGFSELQYADEDLLEHLIYLKEHGHLDHAILLLMADHGVRFHAARSTEQGKYEERLPFMGIRLPDKFVSRYPDAAMNLKINAGRLTTPFDIHETLRDVMNFGSDKAELSEDSSKPLPRGISLFREIPKRRSCADAAIEPHWCACLSWHVVPTSDQTVQTAAQAVVEQFNSLTSALRDSCSELKLYTIISAQRFSTSDEVLKFVRSIDDHGRVPTFTDKIISKEHLYQITLTTQPGGAKFEATVRHVLRHGNMTVDLNAVSRINRYGSQSHCITDKHRYLRQFCYCNVQLDSYTHAEEKHHVSEQRAGNLAISKP